jgi:UDP-N-acetylmuramoylalanine--D-glutamate ligase
MRLEARALGEDDALFGRGEAERSYTLGSRALRGAHNLENAMAAVLLARLCGVSDERIQRGLDSFAGLPHRLELVRTLDRVEWVNDSKATNVDSAVVALRAFQGQRVWLIAGGKGKGAPYQPLVEVAKGTVQGVLTIGQDAPAIARAFSGAFDVRPCNTLEQAVQEARSRAQPGEVVLLSPACASFDQFKSFEDRGQTFRRLVEAL